MASVEANQMLAVAAAACEDKKAEDIRILALDPTESGLTDYFLICTGTNDRQTVAITDEIEIRLKRDFGTYPNSVEGRRQGEWILMDYVDFIVHVFLPEKRAYYGLERLRPSATTLSVANLNTEIKAAITANRTKKAAKQAKPAGPETASSPAKGTKEPRKLPAKRAEPGAEISPTLPVVRPRKAAKEAVGKTTKQAVKTTAKTAAKKTPAKAPRGSVKKTPARKRSV